LSRVGVGLGGGGEFGVCIYSVYSAVRTDSFYKADYVSS
jgi:hypothetical protein